MFLKHFCSLFLRFEQGVRSQIAQELSELRDQQRALCDNLDEIMAEAEEEEEEEISKKK